MKFEINGFLQETRMKNIREYAKSFSGEGFDSHLMV
jgi:hypothetical protein